MSGWLRRLWPRRSKRSGETFAWERTRSVPVAASPVSDGRGPLSQVPYLLPKDVLETDRLNFQHYLIRGILHGDYAAPLRADITSILDSGSGTGRWVTEMARAFPGAQVVGLDIAQPAQAAHAIPPNARLVQANLLDGLPFADRSFDFVHQRLLVLAILAAHWPGVLAELVRVTRPGGWIELLEGGMCFSRQGQLCSGSYPGGIRPAMPGASTPR